MATISEIASSYILFNLSFNNKLTENVNYVNCAFPSLIPESFEYEYNAEGYPTVATTTYKTGNAAKKITEKILLQDC